MIKTNDKKKRTNNSEMEIFRNLEDWLEDKETKYEKDNAIDKIARARSLWIEGKYVVSVHLLEEIDVFLKNQEDKDSFGLIVELLKNKKSDFFKNVCR